MSRGRDIHEDPMSLFLQFECFRMCIEFDRSNLFSIGGVDDSDSAAAEAHINSLRGTVIAGVVCIVLKIDFADKLKGSGIIDVAHATVVVCDDKAVQFRDI